MDERTKVQLTILEYRNENVANGTETPIKQINSCLENATTANDKIEVIYINVNNIKNILNK